MGARGAVMVGMAARALLGLVLIVVASREAAGLVGPASAGSTPAATAPAFVSEIRGPVATGSRVEGVPDTTGVLGSPLDRRETPVMGGGIAPIAVVAHFEDGARATREPVEVRSRRGDLDYARAQGWLPYETPAQCLARGDAARNTREEIARFAAPLDWQPQTAGEMADVFMQESGGCIAVVSDTDDHGCTQIHWTEERARRWDFARIRSECAYAVQVAHEAFKERQRHGMDALSGWTAAARALARGGE